MSFGSSHYLSAGISLMLLGSIALAQSSEPGIPVTDPLVIARCGKCHASDERGNMERISWSRTTPEGWQDVLKDMIVMNGLTVTAEEARPIVKYLSSSHGLAPEEARPVMFDPERRVVEETNIPTDGLREACGKCHSFARSLSWRRSAADWKQFAGTHATRYQVKPAGVAEAVEYLSKAAPLHTPAWDAWSARKGEAPVTGRWLVMAYMPGHGQFYGEMQVDKTADDEFTSKVSLTSVKDGTKVLRTGKSAVYGGTAWRGRSSGNTRPAGQADSAPDDPSSDMREVMWLAGDHASGEGRWFWGQYQEFGFDVKLRRPAAGPMPLLVDRASFKAGSKGSKLRVIGENFPPGVTAADLNLGAGVTVRAISNTAGEIVATLDVAADAKPGKRDVALRGTSSVLTGAIAIYDRIDYMKVTPESAMAAFGDRAHPRGFQQFEAIGYQRGPDGKVHTDDDVELGPVDVTWALQVFHAPEGSSSDLVGKMNAAGMLSPSSTNPNVNFDTWVIATARDDKGPAGDPLVGKAYVVVTIPTYAFNGRQYIRDLNRWVDDGPAIPGRGQNGRAPQ